MARTVPEQIRQLIDSSKHILVTFRRGGDGDAIGSALALALFLERLGKRADIVSDGFELPASYRFLKNAETIRPQFPHLQKFIVSIDVKDIGVDTLTYDIKDEKLCISIAPKQGFLTRDRVRTAQSDFLYDLIFVLDTPDTASLGLLYENNTELFFKTPMVNIDHRADNEHFGHVNAVEVTNSTTAETVFNLLKQIGAEYIDEHIATALLTGIVAKTRSFKNNATKSTTLAHASALVELGANRETIVQHLFRTRTIAMLRLWGQALQHLQMDKTLGLVWSTITRDDMVRCGAVEQDLSDMIDEIVANSPEAKLILLLHEHRDASVGTHGILKTESGYSAKNLLHGFSPTGDDRCASFVLAAMPLPEAEKTIIDHLHARIQKSQQ